MTLGQFFKRVLLFLIGLAILAAGGGLFWWQMRTARRAGRERPRVRAIAVRTLRLEATSRQVVVEATGTVLPARRTTLNSQVAGRVIAVAPELTPGTMVRAGTVLVRLEPDDYQTIVAQAEAQVAEARYALRIEEGQQIVARHDWEAMPESVRKRADRDLVLRKPHLERARARLKAAEAALAKARRDVARTEIRAPYNCVVVRKQVDVGQQVTPQTPLADVAGTDEYWIEAVLPVEHLRWLNLPDSAGNGGCRCEISRVCGDEAASVGRGRLIRLLPGVTPDGRMARVLVSVPHPRIAGNDGRGLDGTDGGPVAPLLLGDYVRVQLLGRELRDIIVLPRNAIHEGDEVWVYGQGGLLEIRHIQPLWHTPRDTWVRARSASEAKRGTGLAAGEEIVVSPIPAAAPGMRLRKVGPGPGRGRGGAGAGPAGAPGLGTGTSPNSRPHEESGIPEKRANGLPRSSTGHGGPVRTNGASERKAGRNGK